MDEVRVDDRRARADAPGGRAGREDRRGRRRVQGAARSTGTPAARRARRELRRARLVLVEHREADVVAALAQRRAGGASRWFSEPEIPATLATWRTRALTERSSTTRSAHDVDRVLAHDRLAELRPTAFRSSSLQRHGSRSRAPSTSPCAKRSSVGEERVEDGVRREHRQAGRRRLVDDLVGRAGAHVVDERVDLG